MITRQMTSEDIEYISNFKIDSGDIRYANKSRSEFYVFFLGNRSARDKYAFILLLTKYMEENYYPLLIKNRHDNALSLTLSYAHDTKSVGEHLNGFISQCSLLISRMKFQHDLRSKKIKTLIGSGHSNHKSEIFRPGLSQSVVSNPDDYHVTVQNELLDLSWLRDLDNNNEQSAVSIGLNNETQEKSLKRDIPQTICEKNTVTPKSSTAQICSQLYTTNSVPTVGMSEVYPQEIDIEDKDDDSLDGLQPMDETIDQLIESINDLSNSDEIVPDELLSPRYSTW